MELKRGVGLRCFYTEKFSTITVCVLFRRQLCRDEAGINSLLAQVFDGGCRGCSTVRGLNNFLEVNGDIQYKADIVKKGEEQIIELFAEFFPEYTETAFRFLGRVINSPDISSHIVERKRIIIEEILKNKRSDKKAYACERCIELLCDGEPFAVSGDGYEGDIDDVDAEALERHWQKVLKTSKIEIMCAGKINEGTAADFAEKYFCFEPRKSEIEAAQWKAEKKEVRKKCEKSDVVQSKLCIGLRTNIPPVGSDWYRAVIANDLFGCSADSALFSVVREKEGLCYYINSVLYRYKGIMLIQAGVADENVDRAAELILKALEDVQKNGFDSGRVKKAAQTAAQNTAAVKDSPGGILDFYLGQLIAGDKTDIDGYINGLKSVDGIDGFFENTFCGTVFVLSGKEGMVAT